MDDKTPEQRSINMSHIRSKNTKPEEVVRKYLFAKGFRYRKNDARYPGKPDLVLPKYHTVIFINGCFWHRHGCKDSTMPKTNVAFWMEKWSKNVRRDHRNEAAWREAGWNVIVVWECALKDACAARTLDAICAKIGAWAQERESGIVRRVPHRLVLPRRV